VVARLAGGGWSAPSAVGAFGAGWGLQIGGEILDVMLILPDQQAIDLFTSAVQVSAGSELSLSLGPAGRAAETSFNIGDRGSSTDIFSYAYSKGLFIGVSVQMTVMLARNDVNASFYGEDVSPQDLLSGRYPPPRKTAPLQKALEKVDSISCRSCNGSQQLSLSRSNGVYFSRQRAVRQESQPDSRHDEETAKLSEMVEESQPNEPLCVVAHSPELGLWRRHQVGERSDETFELNNRSETQVHWPEAYISHTFLQHCIEDRLPGIPEASVLDVAHAEPVRSHHDGSARLRMVT